ncbi:hypothetical protein V8F33_004660 [Rhypophila sp. PSN 637]
MGSTKPNPAFSPIAICGYSCRLPGTATRPDNLWKLCQEGRGAWSEIPKDRFSQKAFYSPGQGESGTTNVRGGHFLEQDVYAFDASFFNMSMETATSMDPVIRMQLETVFEALENAGIPLGKVAGSRSSVFAAAFHRDYHDSLTRNPDDMPRYMLTGTGTAMLSNRISHFFDIRGPSLTVDTGCSSSLSSLHMACRSLQAGDSDMSIVTGGNLMLSPDPFISMSGVGLLSPTGRSYAFDARAEGYGRGEGAVALVLKTLSQAKADGDEIHGIIRASANNQDGKTPTITSPSQEAQELLIRECYAAAGLDPSQTPFVECHGTGTKVGDLCEVSALKNALETESRPTDVPPLYLGSIKSNIGHLEAASGLASIVKVLKAFEHDRIPPNHDFVGPNPAIEWDKWRLAVVGGPTGAFPWPEGYPKRASINSFGYGGANAHLILDAPEPSGQAHLNWTNGHAKHTTDSKLFLLSANDEKSCVSALSQLGAHLNNLSFDNPTEEKHALEALAYKLTHKRTHFKWRAALQASSKSELVEMIQSTKPTRSLPRPLSIGFVFTGQGAHWAGMGKELIDAYPVFEQALRQVDVCLAQLGASWSVMDELRRDSTTSRLDQAEFGMPVCCALQIALIILLRSWGIVPSAVTGHSSGESAAAFAVGALDMRSALAVQYYRGLLTAALDKEGDKVRGGMLAVGLGPEDTQTYIDNAVSPGKKVVIGCFNSPSSVTVSGDKDGIVELEQVLRGKGVFVRRLQVQSAFHSHHMDDDLPKYRQLLETALTNLHPNKPLSAPLASSVTGAWLTRAEEFGPEHWVRYMRDPVLFTDASTKLFTEQVTVGKPTGVTDNNNNNNNNNKKKAVDVIIEIGPHSGLSSPLRQTLKFLKIADIVYASVLKRSENGLATANNLAGMLWTRGVAVDFTCITPRPMDTDVPRRVDPPSYPWNHSARFVIDDPTEAAFRYRAHAKNALLGALETQSNPRAPAWRRKFTIDSRSWPHELVVDGVSRSPLAFLSSMVVEAARLVSIDQLPGKKPSLRLETVCFDTDELSTGSDTTAVLRTSLHELSKQVSGELVRRFQIHVIQYPNQWTLLCQGQMTLFEPSKTDSPPLANGAKEKTSGQLISIHPGALDVKFGIPQPSSVQLELTPESTNVHIQGRWMTKDSEVKNKAFLLSSPRLSSAIQAAVGFTSIQGTGSRILGSIEKITITPETLADGKASSPFYTAIVHRTSVNSSETLSVIWTQGDSSAKPPEKSVTLEGISFRPCPSRQSQALQTNKVYQSILTPSLTGIPPQALSSLLSDLIPRHTLSSSERQVLLDLNLICLCYFFQTLAALRADPPRRLLGHFSSYVQFMKSLENKHADWRTITQLSSSGFESLKSRALRDSINGQLVCRVGDQLVGLIKGESDSLEVMMRDRLLHRYYEQGLRWTRSYSQLKALIALLASEKPRMEILEIGAGTGGATTSVLEALDDDDLGMRCESYTYTDISAGFFIKAKEKFARYAHVMDFRKLDCEKDLKSQAGFGEGTKRYDLVVASQCLHATSNMRKTMANVRKLLKPGGWLVMVETTRDSLDIQLFASCFRGWWLSEEPERKWSPSLSVDLWQQVLTNTGFTGIDFTVKDCEDEDLYAMQVILTSAAPETPPRDAAIDLQMVTVSKNHDSASASQLLVPRVAAFTPGMVRKKPLKPDARYLIRGQSTTLLMATTKLLISLGVKIVVLGTSESGMQVFQSFAEDLSSKTDCQVSFTTSVSPPDNLAGVIDFGEVKLDNEFLTDPGNPGDFPLVRGSDFNIKFVPLHILLSGTITSPSNSGSSHTLVYTGPIIGASEEPDQATKSVQLHTLLLLLADIISLPPKTAAESESVAPKRYYLGVPWTLTAAERTQLFTCSPFSDTFQAISPRNMDSLEATNNATKVGADGVNGNMSPEQIITSKIASYIADMFMFPDPSEVDAAGSLSQYIDSLTASQLRGWLANTFGVELTGKDITESKSLVELAGRVASASRG